MATGYHDFTAGETLTAANLEDFCMRQSVMIFASAAARNSALAAVLQEGMFAFLQDLNLLTVYSGAAWSSVATGHGALTAFDPVITQSGAVAHTVSNSTWSRVGRQVTWRFTLSCTGAGTASNLVTLSLPFNINYVGDFGPCGHGQIFDSSGPNTYLGPIVPASSNTIKIQSRYETGVAAAPAFLGLNNFTAGLASGDVISGCCTYEAAADG